MPKGEGVGSGLTPSEMIKPKHQDAPQWAELADLSPKLAPEMGPGDTQFYDDDGATKPVPEKPKPRLWDGLTLPTTWTTGAGRLLNIRDMGNDHLCNTIRYLERERRTGTKHWIAMCKERNRRTSAMQTMTDIPSSPVVEAIKDAAASKAHEKRQAAKRAVKKQELEDMATEGVGIYKRALSKLGDAFK